MNPSLTGRTSQRPRTANVKLPRTWWSWRMMIAPLCPGIPRVWERRPAPKLQCLKGEARSVQYNLKITILNDYQNLHIPNLKGPPNTDDHSAYLSSVKDVSWSYPAKGNLITARQYYQDLKVSGDLEAIEAGNTILQDKGMMGISQESSKAGQIKCQYVLYMLRSVEGQIIDARDSDYGRDWNIGLYDIYCKPGLHMEG